jgi:hypothetical protein
MFRSILIILSVALFLTFAGGIQPLVAQTLSVNPPNSVPDEEEFTIAIVLDAGGYSVMGIEASISFNEYILQLDGIDPGPWFTGLGHEYFFWDYTHPGTELIHFAGSSLGSAVPTSAVVAICRFTALNAGISPLDFLGVDIRNSQNVRLISDHSSGDSITIDGAIPVTGHTLGRVKALYR